MSDENQLAALQAQLAALQRAAQPVAQGSSWATMAQPQGAVPIVGVSVPVKVQTPEGTCRLYLHLPAECAASPAALLAALESLAQSGVPLDIWQPSESRNSWGSQRQSGSRYSRRGW